MAKSKNLYLLVDGTHANPDDCDVGADNELRHGEYGVPVALNEDGSPQTVGQGAIDNKNVEAAEAGEAAAQEAAKIAEDAAAAAKAEAKVGEAVVTEINPATGRSSDENLLLTTDDVKPVAPKAAPKPKAVKAKPKSAPYKNRELRSK